MRILFALGLALCALAGCQVGTHARNYQPATGPAGAIVNLELADRSRTRGELLAVEPDALLLLRIDELTRISLSQIRRGRAPKIGFDGRLAGNTRERLRLVSRFPQGISGELEGRLLQAHGQSAVKILP
jgi:hypothetical protein